MWSFIFSFSISTEFPTVVFLHLLEHTSTVPGYSIRSWIYDFRISFFLVQTVDVFAIVALSGIVSRLLSTGTVLVATSNRAPNDLNQVSMF